MAWIGTVGPSEVKRCEDSRTRRGLANTLPHKRGQQFAAGRCAVGPGAASSGNVESCSEKHGVARTGLARHIAAR